MSWRGFVCVSRTAARVCLSQGSCRSVPLGGSDLFCVSKTSVQPSVSGARSFAQSYEWAPDWYNSDENYEMKDHLTRDKWNYYNSVIWPPNFNKAGSAKIAEIFHCRENIKYSTKNMWIVCEFVKGRSVDDAIVQLGYVTRKGAIIMKEILQDAKNKAPDHNIEFASNLWIAEAIVTKGNSIKGYRKMARRSIQIIEYKYCNVFIRLEEGSPPAQFRRLPVKTGWEKSQEYIDKLRNRTIKYGL